MALPEKAYLVVAWQDNKKKPEAIPVQFNPTEFSLDKSAHFEEIRIPGLDAPLQQFVRGESERLTLDLFFDTTEDGMGTGASSVTKYTDTIYQLVKIEPGSHAPPICTLIWNDKFPGNDISSHLGNQKRNEFQCI